jgi:hypothetical protein
MKKFLLIIGLALTATLSNAQVIFYVEAPSPNEGNYTFTYAEPPNWGVADLTNAANAVTGNMVLCDDGSAGDSLACNALTNGAAISGNVAVLYRGSCEFGTKALNAENAGAIAVIIINNLGGAPVAMGAGADGLNVTIPVVMIENTTGALLRNEIDAGNTSVFIGSKNGLYADDLGMRPSDCLRANSFGVLQSLSQSGTEFSVEVGAWVRNYGTNDQTDVQLNCTIDLGASNVYDETSAIATIVSGDSLFIPLPTFTQATYANGYYDMVYTIIFGATDESDFDNEQVSDFMITDSLFSLGRLDETTTEPINTTNQFNGGSSLETCIHFQDPNASRLAIYGMNISNGTSQNPDPTSLDGQSAEVVAYEWLEVFTDVSTYPDQTFNTVTLNPIGQGEYIYVSNQQSENVFIPFDNNVVLVDDRRYLFCTNLFGGVYPGYDTQIDYSANYDAQGQPLNVIRIDGTGQWFVIGYGTDQSPATSIRFIDADEVGIAESYQSNIMAYPNPASESITVPLYNNYGDVQLTITDMNGKVVSNQNISMDGTTLTVDVTSLATGIYAFNLTHDNVTEQFSVVVTRK